MSETPDQSELPEFVEYQPLPNIYEALVAGASPYAILTETIDNSVDFVRSRRLAGGEGPETLTVDIRYVPESAGNTDTDQLVVTDNAGGVPPDELSRFFQLGHTDAPPQGIGRFGVGAKRLIGIGDRIRYESHAPGFQAAGFEVDASDLEAREDNRLTGEDVYRSEPYRVDDLDSGHTRIVVEGLSEGVWDALSGEEADEEDSLWRLGETYERFLRDGIPISREGADTGQTVGFEITWGERGEEPVTVDTPEPVKLSWLPFDGLVPRRYEGVAFANADNPESDDIVRADITVGLMPSSHPEDAGLTVTMNDRNVLFRDTENALFSTRYLGKFRDSAGHGRLHCTVELRGAPDRMPWSDTKDSLDETQRITDRLFNVAENALHEYRRQTYDNLPAWILRAYSEEALSSFDASVTDEIDREVKVVDKHGSKVNSPRFNDKPGETSTDAYRRVYPQRDNLRKTALLHRVLRIRCDEAVEAHELPGYREFFESDDAPDTATELAADETPPVDRFDVPTDLSNDETQPLVRRIRSLAERHASEGVVLNDDTQGAPAWLLPRYHEELTEHTDPSSLDTLDQFDAGRWLLRTEPDEEGDDAPTGGDTTQREGDRVDSGAAAGESSGRVSDSADTGDAATDRLGSESDGNRDPEDTADPEGGRGRPSRPSGQAGRDSRGPSDGTLRESSEGSSTDRAHDTPSRARDGTVDLDRLREALGVDDETPPEAVVDEVQRLRERNEELQEAITEISQIVDIEQLLDEPPALNDDTDTST